MQLFWQSIRFTIDAKLLCSDSESYQKEFGINIPSRQLSDCLCGNLCLSVTCAYGIPVGPVQRNMNCVSVAWNMLKSNSLLPYAKPLIVAVLLSGIEVQLDACHFAVLAY